MTVGQSFFRSLFPHKTFIMLVDCQVGLLQMVNNYKPQEFENSTMAHLGLSQTFDLPVIVTTSAEAGPGGPIPRDILRQIEGLNQVTLIQRDQQINPWDSNELQNAVKATRRTQVILAGATMEISLGPLIRSLLESNYDVFVHSDACGAFSTTSANDAKNRMRDAGVQVMSTTAIATELAAGGGDNANAQLTTFLNQYVLRYGYLSEAHTAATKHGPTQ